MTTSSWARSTSGAVSVSRSAPPPAPRVQAHGAGHKDAHRPAGSDLRLVSVSAIAAALVVASLLLLVFVRVGQTQSGYRVHDLRAELVRLQQERAALDIERATLLRPGRLAELSRSLGLEPVDAARVIAGSP